jgi:hypothetical protein
VKPIEVKIAEGRVNHDLEMLDRSIDALINKVEETTDSIGEVVGAVKAPIEKVREVAVTLRHRYEEDSVPFLFAVGLSALWVLGLGFFWRSQQKT